MAIDPAPKAEFEQAYLDDLVAETDFSPSAASYVMPETGALDPSSIEIIVDLDLDEMLLYFYGRLIPHDVEPQSELVSYLIETDSDKVVGVIIHEFMSRAVREYPQLSEAIRWAIIVSGDKIQEPNRKVGGEHRNSKGFNPLSRLRERFVERLAIEGRERTAETVQALLQTS